MNHPRAGRHDAGPSWTGSCVVVLVLGALSYFLSFFLLDLKIGQESGEGRKQLDLK